jgi:hypothetical protein
MEEHKIPARNNFYNLFGSDVDPHWFQCGSDPAFSLSVVPDPGSRTNADPEPSPTKRSKDEFLHEKYHCCISGSGLDPDPGGQKMT